MTPVTQSNAATDSNAPFLTESQVLERIPVCRRTFYDWRAKGLIPAIKANRRVLFHWPSVEAALLRMQRGGQG